MKVRILNTPDGKPATALIYCPACKECHPFSINRSEPSHNWEFNGNMECPTFSPSLLLYNRGRDSGVRCHLFVRAGMLEYCGDCPHDFAGKAIPLPDIPVTDPWHPNNEPEIEVDA